MGLAAVRDLREARAPGSPEELAAFETDVMAGFVLARAAAGLSDLRVRSGAGRKLRTKSRSAISRPRSPACRRSRQSATSDCAHQLNESRVIEEARPG